MWVTKLLISPVKIRIFCPKKSKFGPKMAFLFILGQALPAHLVGGFGAWAVSRKTPIYFIKFTQPGINFRPYFLHRTCWSAGLMVARMANSSHMWLPSNVCTILRGQQANNIKIAVNDVWPKIAQGHLGKSREWGVRRSEPARRPKAERPWGP